MLSLQNAQSSTIAEFRTLNTAVLSENTLHVCFGGTAEMDNGGGIFTLKKAATNNDDGFEWIKPDNILSGDPGRWRRDMKYDYNVPRKELFSGSTNASGTYAVTFSPAYATTPHVNPVLVTNNNTQFAKLVSRSTTGFTIQVMQRNDALGLLPSFANVSGATLDVLVTL